MKQPTRPWILRARFKRWKTGEWNRRWRTLGTYATESAALIAQEKSEAAWKSDGEFYVRHRMGNPVSHPDPGAMRSEELAPASPSHPSREQKGSVK